jgi:D-alanine transaminase
MIVYFNGQFLPQEDVRVSPEERAFLFADGAYEAILSYDGVMFRPEDHFRRMVRSLNEIRIETPDRDLMRRVSQTLLERNDLTEGDAMVYLQVSRGAAPRRHAFPPEGTSTTVYAFATPFQVPHQKLERGIKVILIPDIRWMRCDIKSLALLPNVLANQQAKENGAGEAVFVRDGVVTEGSHTNVCAVFDDTLVTHPTTHLILPGVTRAVVLELCRDLGIPYREAPIFEHKLREAEELMVVGTTSEVMPVVQVDEWTVGDGEPGPITRRLQHAYRSLTGEDG